MSERDKTHDLRTPLTTVTILADLLWMHFRDKKDQAALEHIGNLRKEIQELTRLINNLTEELEENK